MNQSKLAGLNILVLEDELWERKQLVSYLEAQDAKIHQADKLREAREILHREDIDLALLDLQLPDGSGLELLESSPVLKEIPTIFVTSLDSVETAVKAMRAGATDYLIKPCPVDKLDQIYNSWKQRQRGNRREAWSYQEGKREDDDLFMGAGWSGLRKSLKRLKDVEARLEQDLPPVLITGETGTGKSTLARYLHRQGPRAKFPFVEVNASHLSAQLAESELFGHERGAFTDARERKLGLFEAADGGSLFLDEVTQLDQNVQAKLLTVIENHTVRRLGGLKEIGVDVRLIVATNANPENEVENNRFREDLFHRLSLVRLHIPALRETPEELPELAQHLFNSIKKRYNRPDAQLTENALKRIQTHRWPGNIRELRHELERALIFSDSDEIELPGLPEPWPENKSKPASADWLDPEWQIPEEGFSLEEAEKTFIEMALEVEENNLSAAARRLGIPRHVLRYRLQGKQD